MIVSDYRPRPLKVNHKREIRFVESHAERDRGNHRFDFVCEQRLFESRAIHLRVIARVISLGADALRLQPVGGAFHIGDSQAVNDAAAFELPYVLGEPRETFSL